MLNPFPIQFLSMLAYFLLRVAVGLVLIRLGITHLRERHSLKNVFARPHFPFGLFFAWYLGLLEIIIGLMFFFGFYTQIAALLTVLMALKFIIMQKRFAHPLVPSRLFYTLLLASAFSLFITGAGAFAFDLPI